MSAELDYARRRTDQARLVLSATRVALLPPPGLLDNLRGYAGTARTSIALGAVAYIPLGVGLYESNVVNRSGQDTTAGLLAMGAYHLLILLAAGALARRASPRISKAITAGVTAGAILGVLEMATWAWLDNVFFSVISQQPENVQGFRESGMTSMHAYLSASIGSTALGYILVLAIMGAIFAHVGAALLAQSGQASAAASSLLRSPEDARSLAPRSGRGRRRGAAGRRRG
jgi:hypothetical protein